MSTGYSDNQSHANNVQRDQTGHFNGATIENSKITITNDHPVEAQKAVKSKLEVDGTTTPLPTATLMVI